MGPARTVGTGGRCRVLEAVRQADGPSPRGALDEWRRSTSLEFPGGPREWISYPGIFAHGRVDPGNPCAAPGDADVSTGRSTCPRFRVRLGCDRSLPYPRWSLRARVDLLDVDAVALAAAGENVSGARLIPSDGFDALVGERYDLIVSNPPYHEGKAETGRVVERLVRGAPDYLVTGGSLMLVTQRRFQVAALMKSTFKTVEVSLDAGPHRVWFGKK